MVWLNVLGLFLTVLAVAISCIPALRETINRTSIARRFDSASKIISGKYFNILLVITMLFGLAVRLWKFGMIPAGFNQDGAMGAVDALALAHHGTDRFGMWLPVHFTAWGFGQMSVLLSYLSIPFLAVFGLNRVTARLAILIVSLLALWVVYLFVKLLVGRKASLIVLAFCAVTPWQIVQSRWTLDCNVFPHFLLFSIYFLALGLKKNRKFIYISMIFFGLCMYAYGIAWYAVPLLLLVLGILMLKKKLIFARELLLSAFIYLLVAWPIFGVMVINYFKLPTLVTPFFTIPYFPDSVRTADMLFFSPDFFKQLMANIKAIVGVVLLQRDDLIWNTIPGFGSLYVFSIPLAIAGLLAGFEFRKSKNVGSRALKGFSGGIGIFYTLVLIWLSVAIVSGLIINNVNVNRINLIFYPMILLCGIGIYSVARKVKLLGAALVALYIIAFTAFGFSYFGDYSQSVGNAFFDGFGESLDYVEDLDYDRIYVTNWTQSENSWWVSEPLTLFHHSVDALYYQGKSEAWSKSGKPLLPYKERYKYVQMKDLKLNPSEKAVYVGNINKAGYFGKGGFKLVYFGSYFAAVPGSVSGSGSGSEVAAGSSADKGAVEASAEVTGSTSVSGNVTGNLVSNQGFENGQTGSFDGWNTYIWDKNQGATEIRNDGQQKATGLTSACIVNSSANDSRLTQSVPVEGNTYYKLSCMVRAKNVGAGAKGANISVDGLTGTSDDITGTSDWKELSVYGKTGSDQRSFILTLGLGGYGSLNTGSVWFDDVAVVKVDSVPSGARVIELYNKEDGAGSNGGKSTMTKLTAGQSYNISLLVYTAIYILLIVAAFLVIRRKKSKLNASRESLILILVLGFALVFRLATASIIEGWPNDISANKYWANNAALGLSEFYNRGWCDYPPLFIYVLAFIGKLASISWLQPFFTLLIKLPSILADIVTSYMIYKLAKKQLKAELAILACAVYVFNPAVYIDSTVWGQVDSFFTMLVVAALILLMKRKLGLATVFFTASVLMKPQGVFFLPILLFELLKNRKVKQFAAVIVSGILTAVVIVLPFAIKQEPLWIFKLYLGTAGEYPSAAMNALNFFSLIGANFVDGSNVPFLFSYNTWGLIFDVIILGISAFIYFKGRHIATPLITAVLLNSGAFIFSTKMHERYMFPVIAICLLALVYFKEKRILIIFAGFFGTIFLNIHVLFYRMLINGVQGAHFVGPEVYPAVIGISLVNVFLFVYLLKVAYDVLLKSKYDYLEL